MSAKEKDKEDRKELTPSSKESSSEDQPGEQEYIWTATKLGSDLRKAHEAIFMRPVNTAKHGLVSRKLFNVLVHNSQVNPDSPNDYKIELADLCRLIEFNSNNYDYLKNILIELQGIQVEWDGVTRNGKKSWGVTSLVSYVEIRGSEIYYAFHTPVKNMLVLPKQFFRLNFDIQNKFSSLPALALYEICGRYATNPGRLTAKLPWQEWQTMIAHESSRNNPEYKVFNNRILKPAIIQVNQHANFEITLLTDKVGRKIKDLQFQIALKQEAQTPYSVDMLESNEFLQVTALGVPPKQAKKLFETNPLETIQAALRALLVRINNKSLPELTSPEKYFATCVKNEKERDKEKPATKTARSKPNLEQKLEAMRANVIKERNLNAHALYKELPTDNERQELRDQYRNHLVETGNTLELDMYDKSGLRSASVQTMFCDWYARLTWGEPTDKEILNWAATMLLPD